MDNCWKGTIIWILIALCTVQCKRMRNSANEFDKKEAKTLEDKIVWSADKKLKWTDFQYDPNETSYTIYAKVGLGARYNVDKPIMFRSHTTFSTTESIVSDTTHSDDLRIGQAKFDLLETYRRKMETEVDNLKKLENLKLTTSDFDEMLAKYYDNFEKEWESFRPITMESLKRAEDTIQNRLR